jgi:putative nucleotidyltransferase with HDIG domain
MPATDNKEAPANLNKAGYKRAVARLNDLPTIPSTLMRVWRLVDSPDCSASDLGKVIAMDQALSAKVLRLVNSPYYGVRKKITSVQRATTLLGFDTVRSLTVCISVVTALTPKDDQYSAMDLPALWRHSISTGIIAKLLAERINQPDMETVFSAGVLHDLGKFILNLSLSKNYSEIIDLVEKEKLFIREAEERLLEADHTHFGALLSKNWNFPELFQEIIRDHHDPVVGESTEIIAIVQVANSIANYLYFGDSGNGRETDLNPEILQPYGISEDKVESFYDIVREQVSAAQDFMNLI